MSQSALASIRFPVENSLLRLLPAADLEELLPKFQRVALPLRTVLVRSRAPADQVWFLESGTASMIQLLEDGGQVEVGLIGREGMVGTWVLLGSPTSALDGIVQVSGHALVMSGAQLRASLSAIPSLAPPLLRFAYTFQTQVSQSAACNGRHLLEQRLAKWILATHDRVRDDRFEMTQEFMATMLGVRRQGVTVAIGALQRAGLIRHARGHITMIDRAGLEGVSCECYGLQRHEYAWLRPEEDGKDH